MKKDDGINFDIVFQMNKSFVFLLNKDAGIIVVAIEKTLKMRFTASEIQSWANVGEMMNDILKKLG